MDLMEQYKAMLGNGVAGLSVNTDTSPMHTFGLDKVAGSQDVLVKSIRLVDWNGNLSPFAPEARAPGVLLYCYAKFNATY